MVLPNGLETVRQFFTGIRLEHNTHLQHLFLFQVARKLHGVDEIDSKAAELINFLTYSILTFRKRQNWRRIHVCSLIHVDPDNALSSTNKTNITLDQLCSSAQRRLRTRNTIEKEDLMN